MSDVRLPPTFSGEQPEGSKPRPGWRRKRVLIPGLLVALIAFGSIGGEDKQSSEALLSVTQTSESKAEKASDQAARDLAAAEAAARQAAEDRAAAEAEAKEAAAAKATAETAALEAQQKAAAEKAAAQKAAAAQPQPLAAAPKAGAGCTPEYPDFCIPPAGDYNCPDFSEKNFTARPPDPYRLDADNDGIACESR